MLASEVRTYQYDEAGNIEMVTTVTDAGSSTDERTHNDLNQITEQEVGGDTWTFSYDDNGNMTDKTDGTDTWTYSWNDENRLTRVQGPGSVDVSYTYDFAGRMLTRDDGTDLTTFTWHGWDCIKEVTGDSETVYHIPEGQILSFIRDGERYELQADALGSCRMITDEAGGVVARYDFDGWGREISVTEDPALAGFAMRFIGSLGVRHDSVTDLCYIRRRWYQPALGRFISRDPIGLDGGPHLYCYCANDPVNQVDTDGLQPQHKHEPGHKPGINFADNLPRDAMLYRIPGTKETFWAPPEEDFDLIFKFGGTNKNGGWNIGSQKAKEVEMVGHHGKFDVQRKWISKEDGCFYFYRWYSNAANFNVGLYLAGMGFTEKEALDEVHSFQFWKQTKNKGSQLVDKWTKLGWRAGHDQRYPERTAPR